MSTNDPFAAFESERTVIKPRPKLAGVSAPPAPAAVFSQIAVEPIELPVNSSLNPLIGSASNLLSLIGYLRTLTQTPDLVTLRKSMVAEVQRFEANANRASVPNENIVAARYVLCTALDEAVSNTPWGVQAGWSKQSLLVQFHNETWGGEKVFQLLAKLAQDTAGNKTLLELIYCVLALGFEGRYRVLDNGKSQLDAVRQRLSELIRKQQTAPEIDLSPHWRSSLAGVLKNQSVVPLWVIASVSAAFIAIVFVSLFFFINNRSDATYTLLSNLRVPGVQVASAPLPARKPRLAGLLEPEVREGLVTVLEDADKSVVRLRGDKFFASGNAEAMEQALPTLKRIAQALEQVKGNILVTGHSDNQPIRSLRFPSNWHLSTARAENVKQALATLVDPSRLRFGGKADADPIAPNDSAENRARNRRVDIILFSETATAGSTDQATTTSFQPGIAKEKEAQK